MSSPKTIRPSTSYTSTRTKSVPALSFSDEYELQNRLAAGGANVVGSAFLEQERAAVERLATDFARSVVSSILEAF